MTLPYENATSGQKATNDMQKILQRFGCNSFGHYMDFDEGVLMVQFKHRGRPVSVRASLNGYAQAWLKEHPYNPSRMRRSKIDHEKKAMDVASVAVYSILRDWIKGQVTAIETGILTFEGAFLGQILLSDGRTVLEHAQHQDLLPGPGDDNA